MSIRTANEDYHFTRERGLAWDRRFMALATEVASWSKDPSTKVGAVLVSWPARVVLSTGFNGLPRRMRDVNLLDKPSKRARTIHAEMNAVLACPAVSFVRAEDRPVLYATHPPCDRCAVHLIQFGIGRVVIGNETLSDEWAESIRDAVKYFHEAGVPVEILGGAVVRFDGDHHAQS